MPGWKETNTVLSAKNLPKKKVGFFPVLPYPLTQYDTVYTAFPRFKGVLKQLNQNKLPVTCERVCHIGHELQLMRPETILVESEMLWTKMFLVERIIVGH